ncbi:hypothetical protein ILUMI_23544 [Ignelater luminosus]|uniref:Uncharacterized protein n=1 Tax=Ignelater luminosus TaxID=2038154 RepID=A0A8K0FWW2_IGNLU|nr:hypothetical protein ILUMI_23544 [Ignelater luminosus]
MEDMSTGRNESWLNATIKLPLYNELLEKKRGRKRLLFDEASDCNKPMRTLQLRQNYSSDELSYAAQMSLRSDGRVVASKLIKEITTASPKRAERKLEAATSITNFAQVSTPQSELDGLPVLTVEKEVEAEISPAPEINGRRIVDINVFKSFWIWLTKCRVCNKQNTFATEGDYGVDTNHAAVCGI